MKFFITGVNRGLGLSVLRSLLKNPALSNSSNQIIVTGRNKIALQTALAPYLDSMPLNIDLSLNQFTFSKTSPISHLLAGSSDFDHVFHTASPFSRTRLIDASEEEIQSFADFSAVENSLLIQAAKKLKQGGSLIASGAVIGETVVSYAPSSHPWHCGLSSLHKAGLSSILGALAQEYGTKRKIIYANLGTFVERQDNEAKIAEDEVLDINSIADKLVELALSSDVPPNFNVDILSRTEQVTLSALRASKEKKVEIDPVY